jgi:hypothetical protein
MRRVAAAVLAAVLLATAWAPHVHNGPRGATQCAACVLRGAEAATLEPLDLTPALVGLVEILAPTIEAPPSGAPLGAIPGQSPPASA